MAKLLRAAVVSALASVASAGIAQECEKGLMQLQGNDDMELKMKCRAAFAPEVCKEAGRSLGAQPWSNARMEASCAQFSAIYSGSERSLEAAVANKPAPPQATPDATTALKVPAQPQQTQPKNPFFPAKQEKPKGPVAALLSKLQKSKTEAAAKEKSGPAGPMAQLFSKMKAGKEAEALKAKGPLANLLDKFPPKKSEAEGQEKKGPLANFLKNLPHKKSDDDAATPQGPAMGLLKKLQAAKDAGASKPPSQIMQAFQKLKDGAPKTLKLYGDEESMSKPSSSGSMLWGSAIGGACVVAVTTLVVLRRRASAVHDGDVASSDGEVEVE